MYADVREAPAIRRGIAHRLKGEVVSCRIIKQFGADTVKVTQGIRQAVEDIQKLPKGVQIRIVYDQSVLIGSALGGVDAPSSLAAFLVVGVLFVLLGDVRAALVVTVTLPLSVFLAGSGLETAGRRHQHHDARRLGNRRRSAGGRGYHHGREHSSPDDSAPGRSVRGKNKHSTPRLKSAGRSRLPRSLSIAVFLPLFAMSGIEGKIYMPLAAAVIAAIGASLVLALTLVPVASGIASSAPCRRKTRRCLARAPIEKSVRASPRCLHAPRRRRFY